jgi:6-phosphogluconolactonase
MHGTTGRDEAHHAQGAGDRQPITLCARSSVRGLFCSLLCAAVCGCGGGGGYGGSPPPPPPPPSSSLLVVTNAANGTLDLLTINTTTGTPTPVTGNPLADGTTASGVAIDPQKRYLYVASSSGEIRGYSINSSPVGLTAIAGSPFSTSAQSLAIAVDPSGQFVLTANGSAGTVSVFKIGAYGALTQVAGSPFAAGSGTSAIIVTAGHYVYAANTAGKSVSAYSLNTTTGVLTSVAGSPFATAGSPNGLVVDEADAHVYATESGPKEISGFSINAATGALTAITGSPFAVNDVVQVQSPVIDSGDKRLHATDGTNVDCFNVDANTGALNEIGLSYTNAHGIALTVDETDNFLYALDNIGNQVAVFSIASDGSLTNTAGSPFPLFSGAGGQNLGPNAIAVQH